MEKTNYNDFVEVEAKINELEELAAVAMEKSEEVVRQAIGDCKIIYSVIGDFLDTERKHGLNTELSIESADRVVMICKKLLQVHLNNNYNRDNPLIFQVCTQDSKTMYIKKGMGAIVFFKDSFLTQYTRVTEYGFCGGGCRWNKRGDSLLIRDRLRTPRLQTRKIFGKVSVVCDIDYEDFLMSDISI